MFGKPQWFQVKTVGWTLSPAAWQGWAYNAIWSFAIGAPFLLLFVSGKPVESLVWLGASMGGLYADMRGVRRAMQGRMEDDVLVIEDDTLAPETDEFQFSVRAPESSRLA